MKGRLIYVMGPSGAGKDSLLDHARKELCGVQGNRAFPVVFIRRYITRPAAAGGERHHPLDKTEFARRRAEDFFALHWESHGLSYGIGRELDDILASGASAVVSASREYLPEALIRYPDLVPVLVTAKKSVLRSRLRQRGRESPADIEERLAKASLDINLSSRVAPIIVDNSGELAEAQHTFVKVLQGIGETLSRREVIKKYA